MIPQNRKATHPGEILLKEFLEPLGETQKTFASHLGIPTKKINEIIEGKESISPEMAWLFSETFLTSPEFWLNLQNNFDLSTNKPKRHVKPLILQV